MVTQKIRIKPTSMADQVALQLKGAIFDGSYTDGQQLPPLQDLAVQFKVGISTMREAIQILETLGFIEVIHGRGIYVHSTKMHWPDHLGSFSENTQRWGKVPGSRLLKSGTDPASTMVAAQLGLSLGALVHYMKRLRTANDEPVAIEDIYLPVERFPDLLDRYRDPMSLYQLLQVEYDARPVTALLTIEAIHIKEEESTLLGALLGSPALLTTTISYDRNALPVEYGTSLFRADKHKFIIRVAR